jgi:two-component system chemotaxis sensor kinase CheA
MTLSMSRHVLIQECRDLLGSMETTLVQIGDSTPSDDQINAVFRAAHTIKGSAGLFGLPLIVTFTHRVESVLDRVRDKSRVMDANMGSLLLRCGDYICSLVDSIEQETDAVDPDPVQREELLGLLDAQLGKRKKRRAPVSEHEELEEDEEDEAPLCAYRLSLQFDPRELREGLDPIALLEHIASLGEITRLETFADALPLGDAFDPELCYLRFELEVSTTATQMVLENCLTFVRDERGIRITRLAPEVSAKVLDAQIAANTNATAPAKPRSDEARAGKAEARFLKIDALKLDQLINLMGELVIASEGARSMVQQHAQQGALLESMHKVNQLVEQLRDRALGMRMTPIGDVFQRFPRVVRDVSRELGKEIELVISGADTELDKAMVEKLSDPLTHIVRNAMDHGLERSDERSALGKPRGGQLSLHAHHESGCIVIEVSDDGRGLNGERIRAKAIEKKLVSPDAQLSQSEMQALIFLPGFSTAEQVTNLSGRGVGMDVVKRSIEQLRGEVEIDSEVGVGTTLRMRLPLTLAIIDGFQVAVGKTTFVVPLDMVLECVDISDKIDQRKVFDLRGEPLSYVRLRDVFQLQGSPARRESMVVVEYGQHRVGLVVDRLIGDVQAVIKPLGRVFRNVRGVSSSTILGDGSVALILDVPALMLSAETTPDFARAEHRALAS